MKARTAMVAALLAGCSAAWHAEKADLEGNAIADEGMAVVEEFRTDLVDPTGDVPGREPVRPPIEVPKQLTLDDALRIATKYNRGYLREREAFFLTALSLGLTRRDFLKPVFSGSLSWTGSDGRSVDLSETTALALSGTQFLPTGGTVTVSGDTSLGTDSDRLQDTSVSGSVTFTQPLLRGAGRRIAFEPLTQAERNLIYAARDFETFRQNFAITITGSYYDLVQLKKSIKNTENQVAGNLFLLKQAQAQFRLEQGTQTDVLRAKQNHRNAQNDLLDAQQNYQLALDRFKIDLGLPIDVEFDVGDEIPAVEELIVDMKGAIAAALANRLDLLTERQRLEDAERDVMIARNALLPDLNFDATYSIFSAETNSFKDLAFDSDTVTFGLTLEIPLDRKAERNAYRSSLISLAQTQRGFRETEDQVILDIRDSLRRLRQVKQQITNDTENVETIDRRRIRAYLDKQAGIGNNRDTVEAVNDLATAKNSLNARYVDYLISRLQLLQRMGLLFIDKEGRIIK